MFTKWDHRFMEMAQLVSTWASCYQEERKVGAVIVKDKRVMTTGYNGAPAGVSTCVERGECLRKKLGIPSGTRHEMFDALLHPSAVHPLRKDDRQRGHCARGVSQRLSG